MSRPPWATRRARAGQLLRSAPHAEELLVVYIGLTELQERVAERVPVDEMLSSLDPAQSDRPPLHPAELPRGPLLPLFEDFLGRAGGVGTEIIASDAQALLEAGPAERESALSAAAGFPSRAFLEPVLTSLAARDSSSWGSGDDPGLCRACGSRPVVATLQDLTDALGSRSVVCGLCATEWRIDRLRCVHCGEKEADRLLIHTAESLPHVRVEECLSCKRYVKSVDLRERGDAIPVVDELATVELDLWARERGLQKVQVNVLEL